MPAPETMGPPTLYGYIVVLASLSALRKRKREAYVRTVSFQMGWVHRILARPAIKRCVERPVVRGYPVGRRITLLDSSASVARRLGARHVLPEQSRPRTRWLPTRLRRCADGDASGSGDDLQRPA
ncbi:hypothetical protein CHELA1G11_20908 [Hyphomicrobiales bacterium]|nr:hypothetical protein CHELA1G11_20908 [Hyphomicrobiales bacterium]CAH1692541.1 hypothetical protein CHELA1G2_21225 [Hyphomicrobiales bacterium]